MHWSWYPTLSENGHVGLRPCCLRRRVQNQLRDGAILHYLLGPVQLVLLGAKTIFPMLNILASNPFVSSSVRYRFHRSAVDSNPKAPARF